MNKKVPEIRFDGFIEKWKQRKLGQIADIVGGGTPSTSVDEYWNGEINWYSPVEIGNQIFIEDSQKKITEIGLQKSSAKILPVGTVLFTSRAGVGKTAILAKEGTTNQGFQSIIPHKNKLDSYFIYSRTNKLKEYGEKNGAGSTFIEISGKQMKKMPILIPTLNEQSKISNFFKQLDDTIALHQHELENLKKSKKAFLQKMFPKDGETVPEIRFPGFADKWSLSKLKDFGQSISGTAIESEFNENGHYKVISIGSYSESSVYTDQKIRVNKNEKTKNKILSKDDLTMVLNDKTSTGNIIGRVLLIDENDKYVYNQRTQRITPDSSRYSSQFIYQYLNAPKVRLKIIKQVQGNTQIYVNWSNISELSYLVPDLKEQIKISTFLKKFDDSIALHQSKLIQLEKLKKAFLQKMFV